MDDRDNPVWTKADFARTQGPESLGAAERAAFPRWAAKLGPPTLAARKTPVKLRIDPDILVGFKAARLADADQRAA